MDVKDYYKILGVEKSAITAKLNNIMFVIIGIALAFLTLEAGS